MDDRSGSPGPVGGFFAVTPGGNGNAAQYNNTPYSPVYDSGLPYPQTPSYNGAASPPGHQPYNPAAYHPTRHATTAGNSPYQQDYSRPQRHASTAAGGYDPTMYNSPASAAPYPTSAAYRTPVSARPQVQMPGANRYVGYPSTGYPQRMSGPGSYMMSPSQPYSPGLPPLPSQSAPPTNGYQPPPPPPPPHPPGSPAFHQGFSNNHSPSTSLSYSSSSQRAYQTGTHYDTGSESDVSTPGDNEAPHHPLPSPPKDRPLTYRDGIYDQYASQPLPSPPLHGVRRSHSRPLPMVPNGGGYEEVEQALNNMELHDEDREDNYRDSMYSGPNGELHPRIGSVYDCYSNDSDVEAEAGLEMMRHDEELEIERDKRDSHRELPPPPPRHHEEEDDDEDYNLQGVDISMIGGGFGGGYYGDFGGADDGYSPAPLAPAHDLGRADSSGSARAPIHGTYALPDEVDVHPFPEMRGPARVDTWGTGGLVESSQSKQQTHLTYDEEDDHDHESPTKRSDSDDDFPELFYHPGPSGQSPLSSRPLPNPPAYNDYASEIGHQGQYYPPPNPVPGMQYTNTGHTMYDHHTGQPTYVPRTESLRSRPSNPMMTAPVRSKTDGRAHPKSNRTSVISISGGLGIPDSELSPGLTPNDLPAIPLTKKFDPKKLSTRDFRRCSAPWALSGICAWLKEITEGEQDLKEAVVEVAVTNLFTHYVPTMNVADAETLAMKVVAGMLKEKALVKEEEWVKFGPGEVSGVIFQITGNGCYASKLHDMDTPGRCYAHHCARTLRKFSLPQGALGPAKAKEDWATYWKIKKEDIEGVNKKEIERQNNIHEIVQTEEDFMEQLVILKTVFRDQILHANPPIIKPRSLNNFIETVFGAAEAVVKVTQEHLLPQLKFRQKEQGPWILGFSDIFREWIRKAKQPFLAYAAAFPKADMMFRAEVDKNMLFRTFLEQCRADPRVKRLEWTTFLKAPITRIQRYSLLLNTVLKHTAGESEEKANLERAIEEIRTVTLECDSRVNEMSKRVVLMELDTKLMMRTWPVDLMLNEQGRELIFKGDLQRIGSNRFTWLETHCMLFDHYLVLAKTMSQKETTGGPKQERYDVSRMPIPMDLLVLESTDDEPVIRNAANRLGIAGPAAAGGTRTGRHNSAGTVPQINHTNTSMSVSSTATAPGRLVTNLQNDATRDDKILYPFRIKHLGNPTRLKTDDNTYTLYAPSAANRKDWCDKIVMAKERHAASLYAQNAEPFKVSVMADAAFGYSDTLVSHSSPLRVRGTPLDRAIIEVEQKFAGQTKPPVQCRAAVNCATSFKAQFGRQMVAIGTDNGVYIAEANNPRAWTRAVPMIRNVTQIAVLEEFNLFLILSDKSLLACHLDLVCPPPGQAAGSATKQKDPQKLSGMKDVGFFSTGRMKDRTLVFYKIRTGLTSKFKILEPVFQKSNPADSKSSVFSRLRSSPDFFREFDEFYVPTETFGITILHSSMAVHTSKGFEVMNIDKKIPLSIPDFKSLEGPGAAARNDPTADIAARLNGEKPLGMFRLSDSEFLLVYGECGVYVNKHGDVNRSVIMDFVGRAKAATLWDKYVLLFDENFVEVRNAQNGRLRQVIAGREVKMLDNGEQGRTVKVVMGHPEEEGRWVVIELKRNEKLGERD